MTGYVNLPKGPEYYASVVTQPQPPSDMEQYVMSFQHNINTN